jgi:hypothetical protein
VIQNDELANATEISGPKQSLLPSSDVENNNKSLELPCIGLLPESIEECHSPNTEDIEIEVNFIRRNTLYFELEFYE